MTDLLHDKAAQADPANWSAGAVASDDDLVVAGNDQTALAPQLIGFEPLAPRESSDDTQAPLAAGAAGDDQSSFSGGGGAALPVPAVPSSAAVDSAAFGVNPVSTTITIQAAAGDVTFKLELDGNAASAPISYINGWRTAANLLSAAIPINITVNLEIGYGEYPKNNSSEGNGGASAAPADGVSDSYQQLRNLLLSNGSNAVVAAVNNLPNTTSLNGLTSFFVAPAEAKVWGQISASNSAIDGYVGFGVNIDPSAIVGVALHEFTHALGRVPGNSVLSLFRYTSPGQHDFDANLPTGPSYFSVDGGNTDLADFGQTSDPSDFLNPPNSNRTPNDPFNEFYNPGSTTQSLTQLDLTELEMLGFTGPRTASDDYANSLSDTTHPFGQVSVGGSATGTLEVTGDRDWFRIQLSAGVTYTFNLQGQQSGGGTLADPYLFLHDSTGTVLAQDDDIVSGVNRDSQVTYQAAATGTYYIEAAAHNDAYTGTYTVSAAAVSVPDDYANSLSDTSHPFGQVSVGGSSTGTIEVNGDRDWFRVLLTAGVNYTINLDGVQSGAGTLADPYLRLHDSAGGGLAQNDDIVSGVDLDSQLTYQPTTSGTYYIEAGAFADQYTGTYRVAVDTGLTQTEEPSGAVFTASGSTTFAGSQSVTSWAGTATATIANSDSWIGQAGTMAEEIAASTNLSGSSSVFTDPVLLGLGAPTGDSGLAISGNGPATAIENISYAFSAPVAGGNSFILWAPGAFYNSETGPFTFSVSASLNGSNVQTSGWSFAVRSPFGTALPATFTVNNQTGTITVNNYTSNPFGAVIITPNTAIDHIGIAANTIENDLWGFAFSNSNTAIITAPAQDDFNGDGKSDIVLTNTNGTIVDWTMNGSTITAAQGLTYQGNAAALPPGWSIAGTGDFNGDGKSDILLANTNGTIVDWTMSGSTISAAQGLSYQGSAAALPPGWSIAGTGDFDGDGRSDILLANTNGTIVDWTMSGSTISAAQGLSYQGSAAALPPGWSIAGTGDFNSDGKSDILLANTNGTIVDWTMSGSTITAAQGLTYQGNAAALPPGWSIAGIGDFNGDGKSDILLANTNGTIVDWTMSGSAITAAQGLTYQGNAAALPTGWSVAGIGDFNGDGKSDIVLTNTNGTIVDWTMSGSTITAAQGFTYQGHAAVLPPGWAI